MYRVLYVSFPACESRAAKHKKFGVVVPISTFLSAPQTRWKNTTAGTTHPGLRQNDYHDYPAWHRVDCSILICLEKDSRRTIVPARPGQRLTLSQSLYPNEGPQWKLVTEIGLC
jgi:hypothetical protein